MGRMEHLLRLSGLLSEEDGDKTDLGTLEKRLADRGLTNESLVARKDPLRATPTSSTNQTHTESRQVTPQREQQSSPQTAVTSPEQEKSESEVENLSDMMCSLVTNNCGETRYIGILMLLLFLPLFRLTLCRLILWILHLFSERNTMGEREDR